MHRQDPLHHHGKGRHENRPSFWQQFKFTITAVIALSLVCGILAARDGKNAWPYYLACGAVIILVFIGEMFR